MASGKNSKLIRVLALLTATERGRIMETQMVYGGLVTTARNYVQNEGQENEFTVTTATKQHAPGTYKHAVKQAKKVYREGGIEAVMDAIDQALADRSE